MLEPEEGLELLLETVDPLGAETIPLVEASGRVLAQEILARDDAPPFDRSAMDGYAVVAADLEGISAARPVRLKIQEEVPAGKVPELAVTTGVTSVVMTGSPVPKGATAVVRREDVTRDGDYAVFSIPIKVGANIDPRGKDIQTGTLLLTPGTVIGPGEMGLLAGQGYPLVQVARKPRVVILSTGDELLEVDQPLEPGKIRNSNRYALQAAILEAGAEPVLLPKLKDDLEAIKTALIEAMEDTDLVLSTGGVSMGDYDLVKIALEQIAEVLFWKLKIKPGKPVMAAHRGGKVFLGLSGNPGGSLLNFYLLAAPLLRKMTGRRIAWPVIEAVLETPFPKKTENRRQYLWAKALYRDGAWRVTLNQAQASGMLTSLAGYNALVEVPAGHPPLKQGAIVKTILIK